MTTMGVVAAPPAPTAAPPVVDKPTPAPSPFIPPLRKPVEAKAEPVVEAKPAEPEAPPAEAKEAEPESDHEIVEYDPTDEFDVIVNGKPGTVTMAKLIAYYQRGEAANAKFAEAKQVEHRAIGILKDMSTPDGLVRHLQAMKVDPYKLAEDIILARADYEAMTPDQREMERYRKERAEWERQRAEEAQRSQQTQAEREAAQHQARLLDVMSGTLDRLAVKDPGLRNEIISRAAGILRTDYADGIETTPQQAVQEAWDDYRARLLSHSRALPVTERVSDEERGAISEAARKERVRVAPTAPKVQTPPRAPDGKFLPDPSKPAPRPKRFDMWTPTGGR